MRQMILLELPMMAAHCMQNHKKCLENRARIEMKMGRMIWLSVHIDRREIPILLAEN
jgi:hypothetical protein